LGERKGTNVPDVHLNVKSFTNKDQENFKLRVVLAVDYIAFEFRAQRRRRGESQ